MVFANSSFRRTPSKHLTCFSSIVKQPSDGASVVGSALEGPKTPTLERQEEKSAEIASLGTFVATSHATVGTEPPTMKPGMVVAATATTTTPAVQEPQQPSKVPIEWKEQDSGVPLTRKNKRRDRDPHMHIAGSAAAVQAPASATKGSNSTATSTPPPQPQPPKYVHFLSFAVSLLILLCVLSQ